uniref:Sulfate ABC transporter ATP-binding subunit n=1 Tax=Pseudocodium devriesii TaxID=453070 RepID=A0A386B0Z9_9CHLO|nr:Sulfate ABC transporter ATP-binding subunit [Pseudocodium devriesii]AYC65376.1 Sulfate ABC transporter ATP-binding subunit [Pseudocodium devriesii]
MSILIENVSKKFGKQIALSKINLEIPTGNLVALLGPSGSGKSTLLRMLAGFETPESGRIWLFGKNATFFPIQQRQIGFVFQDYALFPKMTIFENIGFGLKIQKKAVDAQVHELLQLTQLENLSNFYPHQLSGGQKQRVAFARALAVEPKILLLDEPFGALDVKVRKNLRIWLRNLHEKIPVTSILITHDIREAMEIADEIVLFQNGYVEQVGCPQEIYEHPATVFVQNFIGHSVVPSNTSDKQISFLPYGRK